MPINELGIDNTGNGSTQKRHLTETTGMGMGESWQL